MISKVSFSKHINKFSSKNQYFGFNSLERCPKVDTVSFGSMSNSIQAQDGSLPKDVAELLDNKVFKFQDDNGEVFKGTLKDYLKDSVIGYRDISPYMSFIHNTQCKETANEIIRKGLDWTKTNRMKCGPGTYFTTSYGAGSEFGSGSVPVEGVYIGNKNKFCVFKPCFYEAVTSNKDLISSVNKLLGGNKEKLADEYVNKYCHDYLQYDMGLDFIYAGAGRGVGAFVVLNDKCMSMQRH